MSPHFSGKSDSRLDLIKDKKDFILITDLTQLHQKFLPKMIIASFRLDRFNDNRGNVVRIIDDCFFDLPHGSLFVIHDFFQMNTVKRERDSRI